MSDVSDNDPILKAQSSPKRRKTKSSVWEHFTKESLTVGCTKARCKYCNQTFAYSNGSKISGTSHLKRHLALGACPKYQNQDRNLQLISFTADATESPTTPKPRKTKSMVWEHFSVESLADGCTKARCNHCNKTFACAGGSKSGTSHLKRHLALGACSRNQHKERSQQLIPFTPITPIEEKTGLSTFKFDQDHCRQDLAKMIILHEYPFHMVEHFAFMNFVQNLQPQFKMVTCKTIKDDCLAIYQKEKQNLIQLLGTIPGRVGLSLDMWACDQSPAYMCLTGHFIDSDWKLHKRILNFKMLPSHTGNALFDVDKCLLNWNIETKFSTLTINDYYLNDINITNLMGHLSNKNKLMLNGRLFFVHCFSHILNLIVQDGLGLVPEIIQKIRESIKYIKESQAHEKKFAEIVQQLRINSTKSLCLDVQTRWDTTYLMLEAALELKQAFARLDSNGTPLVDDWNKVEAICMYLKIFYDAGNVFSKTSYPTADLYFHEFWKIQVELSHATTSPDAFVSAMMRRIQPKFEKFWKDCNLFLAIAVIMDPRFKMKLVEFVFLKIYGNNASMHIKIVEEGVRDLYNEYAIDQHSTLDNVENASAKNTVIGTFLPSGSDRLQEFDMFLSEMSSSQQTKSELDQYLEEPLFPRKQEFDILTWWKINTPKYPTVSKMARDILAIPISSVDSDSIFSTRGRVLDHYRSSLPPETVEALLCAQDWLRNASRELSTEIVVAADKD